MLIRAIRETPGILLQAIERSRSWGEVLGHLLGARDEMRVRVQEEDREILRRRLEDPTHVESAVALGGILERLAESVGTGMIGTGRGKTGVLTGGSRPALDPRPC